MAKGYAILANGGYDIKPTLIKKEFYNLKKKRILNKNLSSQINTMFRKVVQKGTATLSDVDGYEVGGKLALLKLLKKGFIQKKKLTLLHQYSLPQTQSMF